MRLPSLLALALASSLSLIAQTDNTAFTPGWPANPDWQHFVLGPTTPIARPFRIVSTSGQIDNAAALLAPDKGGVATLTRTATDATPTNMVLDYGIEVGGLPTMEVTAASGSPQLRSSYSESLPYLTLNGDKAATHSADTRRYDPCIVSGPGSITNGYTQGGERYQMISLTTLGSVSLTAVGIKIGYYLPGAEGYPGHFICSDETLNKIWYACAFTLQTNMLPIGAIAAPNLASVPLTASPDALTNKIPVIVDGAKRDRSVWSGDLAVQGPVIYYSTGATNYMRESLRLLGSYGSADGRVSTNLPSEWPVGTGPIADSEKKIFSANYTLWWVKALADYYLYTGDKDFLKEEWPIVTRELEWSAKQVDSKGLFVTDAKNGYDWNYYDGPKVGAVTAFNALYFRVLLDSATMADDLGEKEQAQRYRGRAEKIHQAINAELFNAQTGVFDFSNVARGGIAQDANVFATALGVVPKNKTAGLLVQLQRNLWTKVGPKPYVDGKFKPYISPYVSGFELLARLRANDDKGALQLMSTLWGPMTVPGYFYTGAIWEAVNFDGKPALGKTTSLAHGWGAMPATALSGFVLGIQPVSAGYATWRIQPHPGDLSWAQGRAPTPKGPIDVAWGHALTSSSFTLRVVAPAGTDGEIDVPTLGKPVTVFVNGHMVWDGKTASGYSAHSDTSYIYLDHVPGGSYEISTQSRN